MNRKKRILLFPAGPAQKEAFEAAKDLGLHIVAVDRNSSATCRPMAEEFFEFDPGDADEIEQFAVEYHRKKRLSGVLVVGCDIPVSCAKVAKAIGTRSISIEAAKLTVDKFQMKQVLREKGVRVPDFYAVKSADEVRSIIKKISQLMIIKPNDNSGARGVLQLTPDSDIDAAFNHALNNVKRNGVILEVFEKGVQVSTEALVLDGKVFITGFADRNYEYLERFFPYVLENGATLPSILTTQEQAAVNEMFEAGIRALGINNGVAKGDMIYTDEGAKVIEIAGRISGGKFASMIVPESNGVKLLHAALQTAIGQNPDPKYLTPSKNRGVAVRYMFPNPGKVIAIEGEETARKTKGLIELVITTPIGSFINPMTSHVTRSGWAVCSASNRESAIKRAESVIEQVRFITDNI